MAKIIRTFDKQTRKGHSQANFRNLGMRGNASIYSRNQHGEILITKGQPTGKKARKKKVIEGRFAQLECMWKTMTRGQRRAFQHFCEKHNYFNLRRARPEDVFKSLGLQYRLNEFLEQELNLKIEILPIAWDEDRIKIMVTVSGNYELWEEIAAQRGIIN